ncbi:MAG: integrase [archaeon]
MKFFEEWLFKQDLTISYQKSVSVKIGQILAKSIYFSDELCNELLDKITDVNNDRYAVYFVRLLLRYLDEKRLFSKVQLQEVRERLKVKRSYPDQYVPSDKEVKELLSRLQDKHKILCSLFLVSGLRKVEIDYLLKNLNSLKVQEMNGFVKIDLSLYRKNKNVYFAYLPESLWLQLQDNKTSVSSLETYLKRNKLLPLKYFRKFFFTTCIKIGVPEAVADFYQGRVGQTIGSRHYLSRQMLADKFYEKELLGEFEQFFYATT